MAFQILGTSISAIFQVTGLQLGSKFSPKGPALGHVKKFHPLLVKNNIKMNQERPAKSIRICLDFTWLSKLWGPLSQPFFKSQACNWALNLAPGVLH